MEYTAVRYPTKEYRQYRPGSKGLNVHYRAFREQFYGNKAIIKHSFRDIHRNPSVGQYTDQRGIPTYAYKIPNGKMYKTAPLMDRIPRGGSVPRVVGSLGDVQGAEFFTEGTYQPPAAAGQTLNSPFLFGKASQELQDAAAQYQAQTGKPVNAAVIKSKEFKDFYSAFIQNMDSRENHRGFKKQFSTIEAEIEKAAGELSLVNPAINTDQTTQPAPDAVDDTLDTLTTVTDQIKSPIEGLNVVARRIPQNLQAQYHRSFGAGGLIDYPLENQDINDNPLQNGLRIANPASDTGMIGFPGSLQQDSLYPMREMVSVDEFDDEMNTNTDQQITSSKDKTISLKTAKNLTNILKKALKGKGRIEELLKIKIRNRRAEKIKVKLDEKKLKSQLQNSLQLASSESINSPSQAEAESSTPPRRSSVGSDKSVELGRSGKRTIDTLKAYIKKHKIPLPDGWPKNPKRAQLVDLVKNWQKQTNKVSSFLKTLTHFSRNS